jgi:hypothetical protein
VGVGVPLFVIGRENLNLFFRVGPLGFDLTKEIFKGLTFVNVNN